MDKKVVGHYNQSERVVWNYQDDKMYLNNIQFKKIDFEPITPTAILHKKSKLTDLISNVNAGGNLHLIVSTKLLDIFKHLRNSGFQYFKSSLLQNDKEITGYWSLNFYETNQDFIDFSKSEIFVRKRRKEGGTETVRINVNNLNEFIEIVNFHKKRMEIVSIEKTQLIKNINEDFFLIKNPIRHIVSEKLKKKIEEMNITGIEFMPIEMKLTEWLQGGEREKIYGKA